MRRIISILNLCILSTYLFSQSTSNNNYNYINSAYYTKIAWAQLDYLKGNYNNAYDTLTIVESIIPLLNSPEYIEMRIFAELSLKYKNYEKAYEYIRILISDYGYKLNDFDDYKNIKKLRRQKFYNSENLALLEKEFCPDTVLVNEMEAMLKNDQFFRILPTRKDTFPQEQCSIEWQHPYSKQFDSIDSINYVKLIKIIHEKGFPLSKHIKYTQSQQTDVFISLLIVITHISDSANVEKMKQILLENIKTGNCPPVMLANMIDRQCLSKRTKFIYGMYDNLTLQDIFDINNLDRRRAKIGLPPHKLSCEIRKFSLSKSFHKKTKLECDF
ncbi:MAG: hypothetical protein LBG17_05850 [Bacteroidales bacterium]|jgi:hypothetical protein|nr:hypothetical protein [Bacteroidales bacterium]